MFHSIEEMRHLANQKQQETDDILLKKYISYINQKIKFCANLGEYEADIEFGPFDRDRINICTKILKEEGYSTSFHTDYECDDGPRYFLIVSW